MAAKVCVSPLQLQPSSLKLPQLHLLLTTTLDTHRRMTCTAATMTPQARQLQGYVGSCNSMMCSVLPSPTKHLSQHLSSSLLLAAHKHNRHQLAALAAPLADSKGTTAAPAASAPPRPAWALLELPAHAWAQLCAWALAQQTARYDPDVQAASKEVSPIPPH